MATVLAYAMDQAYTSTRRTLLAEYRGSEKVRGLIDRGMIELDVQRTARVPAMAAAAVRTSPQ
jgi:hypothetical protein